MRRIVLITTALFALTSCQVEGELTQDKVIKPIEVTSVLQYTGDFAPTSGISVTGQAKIYLEGTLYRVKLENFDISSGPDLKVYLSKSASPDQFVNLGNLTSATVYDIPQQVDVAAYSHVLIHCQQYNHLYAFAALTAN
jgi:hypothetical protein